MSGAIFNIDRYQVEVHGFSRRQAETIARTAIGQSSKETAKAMDISHRTVESNLKYAMARTGTRNRAHLAIDMVTKGLLIVRSCSTSMILVVALFAAATPGSSSSPDDLNRVPNRSLRVRRRNDDLIALTPFADEDA